MNLKPFPALFVLNSSISRRLIQEGGLYDFESVLEAAFTRGRLALESGLYEGFSEFQ